MLAVYCSSTGLIQFCCIGWFWMSWQLDCPCLVANKWFKKGGKSFLVC